MTREEREQRDYERAFDGALELGFSEADAYLLATGCQPPRLAVPLIELDKAIADSLSRKGNG